MKTTLAFSVDIQVAEKLNQVCSEYGQKSEYVNHILKQKLGL